MKKARAVTLMELVIVVIVIGILAGIALPTFKNAREHSLGKEAIANLKLIGAAQRIYRMEVGGYLGANANLGVINDNLKLSLNGQNWTYEIISGDASNFSLRATRTAGSSGCVYQFTNADSDPGVGGGTCY